MLALLRQAGPARPDDDTPRSTPCGSAALWRGQKLNLPLTAQRILAVLLERRGEVVSYEQLFDLVKTGRSKGQRAQARGHHSRRAARDRPRLRGPGERADAGFSLDRLKLPRLPAAAFLRRTLLRLVFVGLLAGSALLVLQLLTEERQRLQRE